MSDFNVVCHGCWKGTTSSQTYHMADNSFRCQTCLLKEIAHRETEVKAMKAWRPERPAS